MKIINRKTVDAKLVPNTFMLELSFGCEIEQIYVFNVELIDGTIGALAGYFNKRTNQIFITITNKCSNGEVIEIGVVEVSEGQFGIEESIIDGDKEVMNTYRNVIYELSLEIYKKEEVED